jgi:hypothetical protein
MAYKAIYENIYKKAQDEKSWFSLTPYPYLLFRWQVENPKDVHAIAKLASHRTGKHKWCGDECDKIESFIQKWELGQKNLMQQI